MSKPYRKREKKPVKQVLGRKKLVRIDDKTQIEVLADIPDDVAREKYLARMNRAIRGRYESTDEILKQEVETIIPKEVSSGSLEEMSKLLDENVNAEIE